MSLNVNLQEMTAADAAALASKTGKNQLLFLNSANGRLSMIDEAGALSHAVATVDLVTGVGPITFAAGA